jgi:hypothetical protein
VSFPVSAGDFRMGWRTGAPGYRVVDCQDPPNCVATGFPLSFSFSPVDLGWRSFFLVSMYGGLGFLNSDEKQLEFGEAKND